MSKKPNLMLTQDDPEDGPIRPSNVVRLRGLSINTGIGSITPASGSLTFGQGSVKIHVSDSVAVKEGGDSSSRPIAESHVRIIEDHHRESDWVDHLSWMVPKYLREPLLGDLREDRQKMAASGYSSFRIELNTVLQLLSAAFYRFWSRLGWALLLWTKLMDWILSSR